jgi:hypothetical protein
MPGMNKLHMQSSPTQPFRATRMPTSLMLNNQMVAGAGANARRRRQKVAGLSENRERRKKWGTML